MLRSILVLPLLRVRFDTPWWEKILKIRSGAPYECEAYSVLQRQNETLQAK